MPEDYQAILNDLGVDTSDSTEQPTASDTNNDNTASEETDTSTSNDQTNTDASEINTDEDEHERRSNEAFAAMRTENTKYKQFIQHLMKGAGFNGDEAAFIEQLTEAAYKQQASRQGNQVSPEILKRMDSLESQNKSLLDAQNRQLFIANVKHLQDTLNLTNKEVEEFLKDAAQRGVNLTRGEIDLTDYYRIINYDKLVAKEIEKARQGWIAQNNKADSAANPDGKSGKKDPNPTNVNTMAEFDSLLQSIPTDKK